MIGSRLALAVLASALVATLDAGAARADGDPASDYLIAQKIFFPYDAKIPQAEQRKLLAAIQSANTQGFTIRVALIWSDYDLGAVTVLWRKPRTYARFLGEEIRYFYKGRLLIVMPSGFGFTIMLDSGDPDTAFVIPDAGFEYHYSPGGQLAVYRTRDRGETWETMADGLPEPAWATVLREGSAYDDESVYFGTQSGSFFALTAGDTWVEGARHLPPILSVEVAAWSR